MKNRLLLFSAFRSVKRQKISYIAMIVIITLCFAVDIGGENGARNHRASMSDYAGEMQCADINVFSSLLLSGDDIDAITHLPGVEASESGYRTSVDASSQDRSIKATVISNYAVFDRLELLEGEYAWEDDECVVEAPIAETLGIATGDVVSLSEKLFDAPVQEPIFLRFSQYKVTGIIEHPEHVNTLYEFTPYIVVNKGSFNSALLGDSCMELKLRVKGENTDLYAPSYKTSVKAVCERIDEIAADRYEARYETLYELFNTYQSRQTAVSEHTDEIDAELQERRSMGWIVVTLYERVGYLSALYNSRMIDGLKPSFFNIFLITGIVVICAAIGKMVREDGDIMKDMRVNGFSILEMCSPYLFFGMSAVLAGAVLGFVIGAFPVAGLISFEFAREFLFDGVNLIVFPAKALALVLVLCLVVVLCVFCSVTYRKERGIKRWRSRGKLTFFSMGVRNMLCDPGRIVISVVSAAGACLTVILGFAIWFSISDTVSYQEDEMAFYDYDIELDSDGAYDVVVRSGGRGMYERCEDVMLQGEEAFVPVRLRAVDLQGLREYVNLTDWFTGEKIGHADGLIIHDRIAEKLRVGVGDDLTIQTGEGKTYEAIVGAIYKSYIGMDIFASPEYAAEVLGEAGVCNSLMVHVGDADEEKLLAELKETPGVIRIEPEGRYFQYLRRHFVYFRLLVIVLTGFAILMASVVVVTLVDMQMSKMDDEITMLRVNGFFDREIRRYLRVDAICTSVSGIALGAVGSLFISSKMLKSLSGLYATFIPDPSVRGIAISVVIMAVFYLLIYNFYLRIRLGSDKKRKQR